MVASECAGELSLKLWMERGNFNVEPNTVVKIIFIYLLMR